MKANPRIPLKKQKKAHYSRIIIKEKQTNNTHFHKNKKIKTVEKRKKNIYRELCRNGKGRGLC